MKPWGCRQRAFARARKEVKTQEGTAVFDEHSIIHVQTSDFGKEECVHLGRSPKKLRPFIRSFL